MVLNLTEDEAWIVATILQVSLVGGHLQSVVDGHSEAMGYDIDVDPKCLAAKAAKLVGWRAS